MKEIKPLRSGPAEAGDETSEFQDFRRKKLPLELPQLNCFSRRAAAASALKRPARTSPRISFRRAATAG